MQCYFCWLLHGVCLLSFLARNLPELKVTVRRVGREVADDVGLLDEQELDRLLTEEIEAGYPSAYGEDLRELLPVLYYLSGFYMISGHLALRKTARARAKVALLELGKAATKEEIAQLAGLEPDRIGATLSSIPSIARADKTRWGLTDWIDDIYEGIPQEIRQRIKEGGGSVHLDSLLEELPRRFGVSEGSVRASLASPAFEVNHGWVRETDELDFVLGRLDDVTDGHLSNGHPYWLFEMKERYLHGYSIVRVPPELIVALGGAFGCKSAAPVLEPDGSPDVSVIWRKHAPMGPEIGRVAKPLYMLGVQEGEAVRLIIHPNTAVSFSPHAIAQKSRHTAFSPSTSSVTASSNEVVHHTGLRLGVPLPGRLSGSHNPFPPSAQNHPTCPSYLD